MSTYETQSNADHLDHSAIVAIRQAFYEGLGRACLTSAWSRINQFRENAVEFLGNKLGRPNVSQTKIATAIDRSTGEVCRWLQGRSPEWANLMMMMLVLEAEWTDLSKMPAKDERRRGGCAMSLFHIRRHLIGDKSNELRPPKPTELRSLELLFADAQWCGVRRLEVRRAKLLTQIAVGNSLDPVVLDAADKLWGTAFEILQRAVLETFDFKIWQSRAK